MPNKTVPHSSPSLSFDALADELLPASEGRPGRCLEKILKRSQRIWKSVLYWLFDYLVTYFSTKLKLPFSELALSYYYYIYDPLGRAHVSRFWSRGVGSFKTEKNSRLFERKKSDNFSSKLFNFITHKMNVIKSIKEDVRIIGKWIKRWPFNTPTARMHTTSVWPWTIRTLLGTTTAKVDGITVI